MAPPELTTPWGEGPAQREQNWHPRPQMRRRSWTWRDLNGQWDFTVTKSSRLPKKFGGTIQVPFCPESRRSGIGEHFPEGSHLWYRRRVVRPKWAKDCRTLLHVDGADQKLDVYVNGKYVGSHEGGYTAAVFDLTDHMKIAAQLTLCVTDDLRDHSYPYGKQTTRRGGMWYTPVSGIWKDVWMEWVPENYIRSMDIRPTLTGAAIRIDPPLSGFVTMQSGEHYAMLDGCVTINPENPHLWTPEDPYLYGFTVQAGSDQVSSYFALRTLSIETVDGTPRLCLNGNPYFFHGLLDQGYWPESLLTAPDPRAYYHDIMEMKRLGFNTLRKHIKVEPEEFYYQCDRLGMVVFQDMVNNGDYGYVRDTVLPTLGLQVRPDRWMHRNKKTRRRFLETVEASVQQLKNHPSICCWTIFNEGWGQFRAGEAYERLKALDDSRFIDSTSGWFRWGKTDVDSRHIYFDQWRQLKKSDKPLVLSEFGGFTCMVEGHVFNPDHSYGYHTCRDLNQFQRELEALYRENILPAITQKGLCAAIYTQVSDVEDEINGLMTYDRRITKADPRQMRLLAEALQGKR